MTFRILSSDSIFKKHNLLCADFLSLAVSVPVPAQTCYEYTSIDGCWLLSGVEQKDIIIAIKKVV
jgi:hypothetical protein